MVDVAHDSNHWWTRQQGCRIVLDFRDNRRVNFRRQFLHGRAKFRSNQSGRVKINFLINGGHHAKHHQFFNHLIDFTTELGSQFLN